MQDKGVGREGCTLRFNLGIILLTISIAIPTMSAKIFVFD